VSTRIQSSLEHFTFTFIFTPLHLRRTLSVILLLRDLGHADMPNSGWRDSTSSCSISPQTGRMLPLSEISNHNVPSGRVGTVPCGVILTIRSTPLLRPPHPTSPRRSIRAHPCPPTHMELLPSLPQAPSRWAPHPHLTCSAPTGGRVLRPTGSSVTGKAVKVRPTHLPGES
jgi:hypothetical protein